MLCGFILKKEPSSIRTKVPLFAIPPNFFRALLLSLLAHSPIFPLTQESRQSLLVWFGLQLRSDLHNLHTDTGLPPSPALYRVLRVLLSPSMPFMVYIPLNTSQLHLTIWKFICQVPKVPLPTVVQEFPAPFPLRFQLFQQSVLQNNRHRNRRLFCLLHPIPYCFFNWYPFLSAARSSP